MRNRKQSVPELIDFIPNDPLAVTDAPMQVVSPTANRSHGLAGLEFARPQPPADKYPPGTDEFLYWQSRDAALRAISAFESCAGPLDCWAKEAANPLPLYRNAGQDLNAFYDRRSLSFFSMSMKNHATYAGASTDVVAHEVGHALLDSLRPDLWGSPFPEHASFHEAFGDCMALMTSLADETVRRELLGRAPDLGEPNFVEATAEDLSDGVLRMYGRGAAASLPRHALNRFQWQLPSLLPPFGGPNVLTGEVHSFARIFSGCFYDTIRNIFNSKGERSSDNLAAATHAAGELLIAGAKAAVDKPRFFQQVGNAMLAFDQQRRGGSSSPAVTDAFKAHSIELTSAARAALAQPAVRVSTPRRRKVSLAGLHPRLESAIALAPAAATRSGRRDYSARTSAEETQSIEAETRYFVQTLLNSKAIDLRGGSLAESRRRFANGSPSRETIGNRSYEPVTHAIVTQNGIDVLVRIRFA